VWFGFCKEDLPKQDPIQTHPPLTVLDLNSKYIFHFPKRDFDQIETIHFAKLFVEGYFLTRKFT
jgi:hypothetical protein